MNAIAIRPGEANIAILWFDAAGFLPALTTEKFLIFDIARWRRFEPEKLRQLLATTRSERTVLWVDWAERPQDFRWCVRGSMPEHVLLVMTAGERGSLLPIGPSVNEKYRLKDARRRRPEKEEHWDGGEVRSYKDRLWDIVREHRDSLAARAAVDATPIEAKCCGISHTLGSYRALELLGADDRIEGFTAIHTERRECPSCKSTLTYVSKRLLAGSKR